MWSQTLDSSEKKFYQLLSILGSWILCLCEAREMGWIENPPRDLGMRDFTAPGSKGQWDQNTGLEAGALGLRILFSLA